MSMGFRDRSLAEMTMLPPPMDDSPVVPSATPLVPGGLRLATARTLARQARAAFHIGDVAFFEGAIGALVDLAASSEPGRRRS